MIRLFTEHAIDNVGYVWDIYLSIIIHVTNGIIARYDSVNHHVDIADVHFTISVNVSSAGVFKTMYIGEIAPIFGWLIILDAVARHKQLRLIIDTLRETPHVLHCGGHSTEAFNGFQRIAAIEGIFTDVWERFRKCHTGKAYAAKERIEADAGDGIGNDSIHAA